LFGNEASVVFLEHDATMPRAFPTLSLSCTDRECKRVKSSEKMAQGHMSQQRAFRQRKEENYLEVV
jgi:hypothetical protein